MIEVFSSLSGLKLGERKNLIVLYIVQYTGYNILDDQILKNRYFPDIRKFQTFITTYSFAWA